MPGIIEVKNRLTDVRIASRFFESSPLVSLERISKIFSVGLGKVNALKEVTLDIRSGEFASILGPSGSGKSTLLHIIGLLSRPSSGKVVFEGEDVSGFPEAGWAALRSRKIGFVFQSFHLLSSVCALENVELPLIYQHMAPKLRKLKALEALEKVHMTHRAHHFPRQLSGGESQRVAIARALVSSPSMILADEPTGNLDTQTGRDVLSILRTLNKEGTTLVIVTHDWAIANQADRKIFLQDGSVLKCSGKD